MKLLRILSSLKCFLNLPSKIPHSLILILSIVGHFSGSFAGSFSFPSFGNFHESPPFLLLKSFSLYWCFYSKSRFQIVYMSICLKVRPLFQSSSLCSWHISYEYWRSPFECHTICIIYKILSLWMSPKFVPPKIISI